MSEQREQSRAALPAGTMGLLSEMLLGGLDLVTALELIEHGWASQRAQASRLARGAAAIDRGISRDAAGQARSAWRELTDRVVRGDAFVESLFELFTLAPAMQPRLRKAEASGALGRVLSLLDVQEFGARERLLPEAGDPRVFFDAMLRIALSLRATRLEFVRGGDFIEAACLGPDGASLGGDRFLPGDPTEIRAEWDRTVRRAHVVLRLGERKRTSDKESAIEAVYDVDDERLHVRCEPISSLAGDVWSLEFASTPVDPGEADWLIYG